MFDWTRRKKIWRYLPDNLSNNFWPIRFLTNRFIDIFDRNCVQTFSTNFVERKQSIAKARTLLQRFNYTVGAWRPNIRIQNTYGYCSDLGWFGMYCFIVCIVSFIVCLFSLRYYEWGLTVRFSTACFHLRYHYPCTLGGMVMRPSMHLSRLYSLMVRSSAERIHYPCTGMDHSKTEQTKWRLASTILYIIFSFT